MSQRSLFFCCGLTVLWGSLAGAQVTPPGPAGHQQLARDILKELVEINTTDSSGDNTRAAERWPHVSGRGLRGLGRAGAGAGSAEGEPGCAPARIRRGPADPAVGPPRRGGGAPGGLVVRSLHVAGARTVTSTGGAPSTSSRGPRCWSPTSSGSSRRGSSPSGPDRGLDGGRGGRQHQRRRLAAAESARPGGRGLLPEHGRRRRRDPEGPARRQRAADQREGVPELPAGDHEPRRAQLAPGQGERHLPPGGRAGAPGRRSSSR